MLPEVSFICHEAPPVAAFALTASNVDAMAARQTSMSFVRKPPTPWERNDHFVTASYLPMPRSPTLSSRVVRLQRPGPEAPHMAQMVANPSLRAGRDLETARRCLGLAVRDPVG